MSLTAHMNDATEAASKTRPIAIEHVALGLYWAWVWLFYECDLIFANPYAPAVDVTVFKPATLLVMATVLIVGAICARGLDTNRGVTLLSSVAIFAGPLSLVCLYLPPFNMQIIWCILAAGISQGALAFLWAIYILQFSNRRSRQAYSIAISVVIGAAAFMLVNLCEGTLLIVAAACLPAISGVICLASRIFNQPRTQAAPSRDSNADESIRRAKHLKLFYARNTEQDLPEYDGMLIRIFVALLFYGMVYGSLRLFATQSNSDTSMLSMLLFCIAGLGLAVYVRKAKQRSLAVVWRLIFPIMLVGLIALPLFSLMVGVAATPIAQTGYLLFESIIWIILFDVIFRLKLNGIAVYGIGRGISVVGMALGGLLPGVIDNLLGPDVFGGNMAIIGLGADIVLIAASYFLLNEKEVAAAGLLEIDENARQQLDSTPATGTIPHEEACRQIAERYRLTAREQEVLELLVRGKSGPQISETLVLSKATVKTHTYNIYRKLEVHTRAELLAREHELVNGSFLRP